MSPGTASVASIPGAWGYQGVQGCHGAPGASLDQSLQDNHRGDNRHDGDAVAHLAPQERKHPDG